MGPGSGIGGSGAGVGGGAGGPGAGVGVGGGAGGGAGGPAAGGAAGGGPSFRRGGGNTVFVKGPKGFPGPMGKSSFIVYVLSSIQSVLYSAVYFPFKIS